jgi:hypothetical protein
MGYGIFLSAPQATKAFVQLSTVVPSNDASILRKVSPRSAPANVCSNVLAADSSMFLLVTPFSIVFTDYT